MPGGRPWPGAITTGCLRAPVPFGCGHAAAKTFTGRAVHRRPAADLPGPHRRRRVHLSPPAVLEPGERTGRYRRRADTLLLGADGESRISAEDPAVAVLDELRTPATDRHFTVVHATG